MTTWLTERKQRRAAARAKRAAFIDYISFEDTRTFVLIDGTKTTTTGRSTPLLTPSEFKRVWVEFEEQYA